jgi:4-amino-4-deoxy-L-arabinose transferase-like glycosyltransferase
VTLRPTRTRDWLVVVLAAAAVSLPYLDKPFHIDDVLYLRVADQILRTPDDPYKGVVLWDAKDGQPASLFLTDHNPPLWKYCQAGVLAAFAKPNERGESERLLHLLQTAAVIGAALGLYQLGRRFCPFPLWATLAVLTAPFFLPGVNIMLEAPALCFCLWAIEFQCRAWDSDQSVVWSLLAGVVASLAILTKYTSGLLLPLLFLESLRRRNLQSLWFLLPPITALAGWAAWGVATHGRPHLGAHGLTFNVWEWHLKALNVVRLIGGMQVFGLLAFLAVLWCGERSTRLAMIGVAILGVLLTWLDVQQAVKRCAEEFAFMTPLQQVHFSAFDVHGFLSLAVAFALTTANAEDRSSASFLRIWMAMVLAFNVCCTPFNAVRHLLMFFVPFVWTVGCCFERFNAAAIRWPALAVSAALGFSLASADHQFAASTREIARTDFRSLVNERSAVGRTVWFSANWGLVHYGTREGGLPWIKTPESFGLPPIQEGDLLVEQKITSWATLDKALPEGLALQKHKHWQPMAEVAPTPAAFLGQFLRTIAPNANYYTVTSNTLPWEFLIMAVDPLDRETGAFFTVPTLGDYMVYRVVRMRTEQEAR